MDWESARGLFHRSSRRSEDRPRPRLVGSSPSAPANAPGSGAPPSASPPSEPRGPLPRGGQRESDPTSAIGGADPHDSGAPGFTVARASSLCVASGKGGTGKSMVTASLARLLAGHGRALVVDADLGVGNAHILQGVVPPRSLADVAAGLSARDALAACGPGVDLLAGGSGFSHLAGLDRRSFARIAAGIAELETEYHHLLVDSAAGISRQTIEFAAGADQVLLVTTPVLTALTDAYAFLKVLQARAPGARVLLVVNRAENREEAHEAAQRVASVAERFLGHAPRYLGWLPEDLAVKRSANGRRPVVALAPEAPIAEALRRLAERLLEETAGVEPRGLGRRLRAEDARPAGRAAEA